MAIVKMDRMTIIGLTDDQEAIVESLMKLAAFEVISSQQPDMDDGDKIGPIEDRIIHTQNEMTRLDRAVALSKTLSSEKKGMFTLQRPMTAGEFKKISSRETGIMDLVSKIEHNTVMQDELLNQQAHMNTENELLEPWLDLKLDLATYETQQVHFFIGSLDEASHVRMLEQHFSDDALDAMVIPLDSHDPDHPGSMRVIIAGWKPQKIDIHERLRKIGFNPLPLHGEVGTAAEIFDKNREHLAENDIKLKQLKADSIELAVHLHEFEALYDHLNIRLDRLTEMSSQAGTKNTFWLEGWIPSKLVDKISMHLSKHFTVALESRPALQDEAYPILLENNKFVKQFEVIGEMFSPPTHQEADPSPWVAPFYFFFFGIMLSDVAYGLILTTLCALLVYKVKVQGDFRRMSKMLMYCGISSTIWGLLFGGFFGDMLTTLSGGQINMPAIWFSPMDNPTQLMLFSILFGVIHLFIGMFARALALIRTGHWMDALLDIFPWYLIIIGVGLMISGMGGPAGTIMALAGAATLVLFGGRPVKNPLLRLVRGLGALYGITSYLSDILSYTRILALVLATSVIAMVVNLLGFMMGPSIPGIIVFIIVAIAGHTLNLALSALSAYVHTSRLHYVEYFGKFYDGGGRMWKPLRQKTKYTRITKT